MNSVAFLAFCGQKIGKLHGATFLFRGIRKPKKPPNSLWDLPNDPHSDINALLPCRHPLPLGEFLQAEPLDDGRPLLERGRLALEDMLSDGLLLLRGERLP